MGMAAKNCLKVQKEIQELKGSAIPKNLMGHVSSLEEKGCKKEKKLVVEITSLTHEEVYGPLVVCHPQLVKRVKDSVRRHEALFIVVEQGEEPVVREAWLFS